MFYWQISTTKYDIRFKNRPKMTFDDARAKADQEFELTRDPRGEIEYSPK